MSDGAIFLSGLVVVIIVMRLMVRAAACPVTLAV